MIIRSLAVFLILLWGVSTEAQECIAIAGGRCLTESDPVPSSGPDSTEGKLCLITGEGDCNKDNQSQENANNESGNVTVDQNNFLFGNPPEITDLGAVVVSLEPRILGVGWISKNADSCQLNGKAREFSVFPLNNLPASGWTLVRLPKRGNKKVYLTCQNKNYETTVKVRGKRDCCNNFGAGNDPEIMGQLVEVWLQGIAETFGEEDNNGFTRLKGNSPKK